MDVCEEHQELVTAIALIQRDTAENIRITREILKCLKGNGSMGLKTQIALNKASLTKAWWWLSGISLTLLGIAGWVIRTSF